MQSQKSQNMVNDKVIGFILAFASLIGIGAEIYYALIVPLGSTDQALAFTQTAVYWALAIPVLVMTLGVLAIMAWIGFTLIVTPPPEVWDVDELEKIEVQEPAS